MLIDSVRLTEADRLAWDRLERYDARLSADPSLDRLVSRGLAAIARWRDAGPGVCSTSWGKDSTVVAHLTALSGLDIPIVRVRCDPWEMPETDTVRDAFLAAYPAVRYEERRAVLRNPKRGQPGYVEHNLNPDAAHQDVLGELIRERYISGLRAEESRIRALSLRSRGVVTRNTCRPIAAWTATQVFAYLYRERLPVHPAYAASCGGHYDRRWLRVHPLCSAPPARSAVYGRDMGVWEDQYWPEITGMTSASSQ